MKGADYNKLEKKQAKKDQATLVKNSGRGNRKGDARTDEFLIDYKFTGQKSFSLNLAAFKKHELDAFKEQLVPVFVVAFENGKNIAMLEWETLQFLLENNEENS